jgi:phospholipid/cholesterol/gamma-HCH transport system permease protein
VTPAQTTRATGKVPVGGCVYNGPQPTPARAPVPDKPPSETAAAPSIRLDTGSGAIRVAGAWTTAHLPALERRLAALEPGAARTLDAGGLSALDTGGALLLRRVLDAAREAGRSLEVTGLSEDRSALLGLVESRLERFGAVPTPARETALVHLGRSAIEGLGQAGAFLAFIGEASMALLRSLLDPRRVRLKVLLANLQRAGVEALPIVGLLSFLLGIVIAYQGGIQLALYGANIFVVELVSLTMLRELAPMMTAIIVAGRTGSAYTAQIGTMRVTEEVDALRTIGIAPMDLLVLPKLFALMLALPLLTVFADALGVLGGMVMAKLLLGVDYREFFQRMPETVPLSAFVIGVGKAPVFAAIVAVVGCFQGFQVSGGADAVGRHTTASVVQAIFLVIVADAAFSILFSWLEI